MINTQITPPVDPSIALRVAASILPSAKVVSIVDSSVSIETSAAARVITFDAENTGLLYFRYSIIPIIAMISDVNVYAAMVIAVIIL